MSKEEAPAPKKLHPDSEYIMQQNIGPIIAKGLATVYKEKPHNPVDFFAKWLLQQSNILKANEKEARNIAKVEDLKKKEAYEKMIIEKAKEEKKKLRAVQDEKIDAFKKKIQESDDLYENLPDLVAHIKDFTGATACYVGVVDKPIKGIKKGLLEDDNDTAHLIPGARSQISILHASEGYEEIMKDEVIL